VLVDDLVELSLELLLRVRRRVPPVRMAGMSCQTIRPSLSAQ
jgi:hypothetical protein